MRRIRSGLAVAAGTASAAAAAAAPPAAVRESARELPVLAEVDVAVAGGSSAAVAAACAAAREGARVFLAAPRSYLGDDLAGTYRLWLEDGEEALAPLAQAVFATNRVVTPLQAKRACDGALLEAGVRFLTGSFATDALCGPDGAPAGFAIANRTGRQAVRAKVVIDATERAVVARAAGAVTTPYPAGPQRFARVVAGGAGRPAAGAAPRRLPFQVPAAQGPRPVFEYALDLPMADGSAAAFAAAEQAARDLTFDPGQVDESETLFHVPPDVVRGSAAVAGAWPGAARAEAGAFRPAGLAGLFVLGPCADVNRAAAASMLRPAEFMALGERIGRLAASEARTRAPAAATQTRVRGGAAVPAGAAAGEVRENLAGLRAGWNEAGRVASPERALPVLGRYDVVVVGGGTAGAPAAIGAARQKARTLVVECQAALGGVGTVGLIGKYYHGYRKGFTAEVDRGVAGLAATNPLVGKMEWWRAEARRAGAEVWMGSLACGALADGTRVRGAVLATPAGRGVVLADCVVDATGNADVAAAAGAACVEVDATEPAVQGAGLPPRRPGANYTNTDYTFADDSDAVDLCFLFVAARARFAGAYDVASLVDTRERRRIVGEFTIQPTDLIDGRTYPDTLVYCASNFDSHGFTVHPLFLLEPPDRAGLEACVPYRALLPKGWDGILVTGLAISAHRDAMPVLRMQPDVQNQGYAAGIAAAWAARDGRGTRSVPVAALQRHLVEIGSLPPDTVGLEDSHPLPAARIAAAVEDLAAAAPAKPAVSLSVALGHADRALPLLREAFERAGAAPEARLRLAHLLAVLGDPSGSAVLAEHVAAAPRFDAGWNFRGMGQYGRSVSPLDSAIIALGRTRDARALPVLLDKARQLDAKAEFSHHRAVALALEALAAPEAAPVLADVLAKPGMAGHAVTSVVTAVRSAAAERTEPESRNAALREVGLARALFRCGDHRGIGEATLRAYARDLRGPFARHAGAVLAAPPGGRGP